MPRFFVTPDDISDGVAAIRGEDARHIARSLRMAEGERVTVCDGTGNDYFCRLRRIRDDIVEAEIESSAPSRSEPPYKATVFQALVKGDRADTVITKSVEYGAAEIVFFDSSRCIVKAKDESENKRVRRSRLAAEAAKQCGRGIIPEVSGPVSFDEMLRLAAQADSAIFCYENEKTSLLPALLPDKRPATLSIVIGPEGGFSEEEAEEAAKAGLSSAGLGERILRTESAAPFVLAAASVKYELGAALTEK